MMKSIEIDPRSKNISDLTSRFEINSNLTTKEKEKEKEKTEIFI